MVVYKPTNHKNSAYKKEQLFNMHGACYVAPNETIVDGIYYHDHRLHSVSRFLVFKNNTLYS